MINESLLAKEFIEVIENTDKSIVEKIPVHFIEYFKNMAKNCNQEVVLENGKKLKDQNISDDCKKLISVVYYTYIVDDKGKKELLERWSLNE